MMDLPMPIMACKEAPMTKLTRRIALALSWILILPVLGPSGAASVAAPFWANVGPVSGLTWSVAVHPLDPAIVFVGTEASGLYRSGDHGAHWNQVGLELNLQYGYFPQVIFDPQAPDTVYAVGFGMLIKSTDAGNHWAWLETDTPGNAVSLTIDPHNSQVFYLTRGDGFFRSTNGGAHFTKLGNGLPAGYPGSVTVAGRTGGTLLLPITSAGVSLGAYRSTDGGSTWAVVQGLPAGGAGWQLLVDPSDGARVYAAGAAGLYKSSDSAEHWAAAGSIQFCSAPRVPLAAGPGDAIYAGACNRVYRSRDHGLTWSTYGAGGVTEVSALAADPSDVDVVWAATRHGLWVTKAGDTLFLPTVGLKPRNAPF
jgi:photosystem II stability/assembly factor-like uncharacterized protein